MRALTRPPPCPVQLENIGNFLRAITRYGVKPHDIFEANDLFENTNHTQVQSTLIALASQVTPPGGPGGGGALQGRRGLPKGPHVPSEDAEHRQVPSSPTVLTGQSPAKAHGGAPGARGEVQGQPQGGWGPTRVWGRRQGQDLSTPERWGLTQAKTKGNNVGLGVKYAEKQQRRFHPEKLREGRNIIGLQVTRGPMGGVWGAGGGFPGTSLCQAAPGGALGDMGLCCRQPRAGAQGLGPPWGHCPQPSSAPSPDGHQQVREPAGHDGVRDTAAPL